MEVGVQVSVAGSYLPPVLTRSRALSYPPHTIMRLPVQTAVRERRASGALPTDIKAHSSSTHSVPVAPALVDDSMNPFPPRPLIDGSGASDPATVATGAASKPASIPLHHSSQVFLATK